VILCGADLGVGVNTGTSMRGRTHHVVLHLG